MQIKGLLLALLVASLFAYIGIYVNNDLSTVYSVTMNDSSISRYQHIQNESYNIADKMNQTSVWLQDLTSGDILGFVYAMPVNIANILGIFILLPNIALGVLESTLAVFGIPPFVIGIIGGMLIISVLLIIVGIWTEGRI